MAQQTVDTGAAPDDGNGDPLRTAMTKINSNFTELYARVEIVGEEQNYADLVANQPVASHTGEYWFVYEEQGSKWFLNYKEAGVYRSNGTTWVYMGAAIAAERSDSSWELHDNTTDTKRVGFELSGGTASTKTTIATSQTTNKTITTPDKTGTLMVGSGATADEEIARFSGTDGEVIQGSTNNTLNDQGHLKLKGTQAAIDLAELSASPASQAATGHFWVKDDVPSRPKFTDDTGAEVYLDDTGGDFLADGTVAMTGNFNINTQSIEDANSNELLKFGTTASAVNDVTVTNGATGSGPTISATGDDTDIDLKLTSKGAGEVFVDTSLRVDHTSTHDDDHAVEIDVDAAGNADVKAIDVVYTTGALASGEDDAVILVNIDETAATGGEIVALEVLSTEGSADGAYAIKAGAVVGPVLQDSGTFANPTTGTNNTTGPADVNDMIDGSTGTSTTIFVADNDYILIGAAAAFSEIEFILQTPVGNPGVTPTFGYSTAGAHQFQAFVPVDGTNGFQNSGVVAWETADLTSWVTNDDTGTYDIKITRTHNSKGSVSLYYAKTAVTVVYSWDKDGDVSIKNLQTAEAIELGHATDTTIERVSAGVASIQGVNIVTTSSTDTLTNKTFDANGTGNSLSNVETADIAAGSKSGADATLVTGTAGTAGNLAEWDANGDAIDSSLATSDVVTGSSTDTFTNKTFDANGTGNSLSNVDVADLSVGTDGELITWDSAGNPTTVGVGTSSQVLTSNGAGAAPTFQTAAGGGNVSNTGTPVNDQLAVWTDATTVEGTTSLTFDGTDLKVGAVNVPTISSTSTLTNKTIDANGTGNAISNINVAEIESTSGLLESIIFFKDGNGTDVITAAAADTVLTAVRSGTITGWYVNGDDTETGGITADILKNGTSIVGVGTKPFISASNLRNSSTTLTSWTTTFVAGDRFKVSYSGITTFTSINVTLTYDIT